MRAASMTLRLSALLLIVATMSATRASAQVDSTASTRASQAVDSAQRLQRAGDYAGARALLARTLPTCAPGATGAGCRGRINYGLGYIAQLQASSDSAVVSLTGDATRAYRAVLADFPAHQDALRNSWIAYTRVGAEKLDTVQLRDAMSADPARRSGYLTLLGDYYAARKNPTAARRYYRSALQAAPRDAEAQRRLLLTYDVKRSADVDSALVLLDALEITLPEVALDGYQRIVLEPTSAAGQDRALVRWLTLSADRHIMVDDLMNGWPTRVTSTKPLSDLRQYLASPWTAPTSDHWWIQTRERRAALSRLALGLGDQMLAANRAQSAERCWLVALDFGGSNRTPSNPGDLDLQRSLALLYDGHPEFDRGGDKFRAVEERIFDAKAMMIARHDLLAEQRYHTALAIIYAQRGQWKSPTYAHDALFQLNATLRVAFEREQEAGTYQPLPLVRELLATGLQTVGQVAEGSRQMLEAVRAYLDVDDIRRADSLLQRIDGAVADVRPLRQLIQLRDRGGSADCASRATQTDDIVRALPGRSDFAARQRFKLVADCAVGLQGQARIAMAAKALTLATTPSLVLTGAPDLVRLDALRLTVLGHLGIVSEPTDIRRGSLRGITDTSVVHVRVSLGDEPSFIPLPTRDRVAANVAASLAGVPSGLRLHITGRDVEIIAAPTGVDRKALGDQIGRVEGVGAVRIKGS
jgi:tetratricopeptide (TPR) repeat protein